MSRLAPASRDMVLRHSLSVRLSVGQVLKSAGEVVPSVWFPERGVVAVAARLRSGRAVGSQLVGSEGAIGLLTALGDGCARAQAVVRAEGVAHRISAKVLRDLVLSDRNFVSVAFSYAQVCDADLRQGAACSAAHPVAARLSTWLLGVLDRGGGPVIEVTHDSLAEMLGVQRTTLTQALLALAARGVVSGGRGRLAVVDRAGLAASACACHRDARWALGPA